MRSSAALRGQREFWIAGLLPRAIITRMSRLRRLALPDRWFFITCRVLPRRRHLSDSEFATLAQVIAERRAEHSCLLAAWVFLPGHWQAIFYPRHALAISRVVANGLGYNGMARKSAEERKKRVRPAFLTATPHRRMRAAPPTERVPHLSLDTGVPLRLT